MGENHPSEVLFALWYYRANGLPSISQEDFWICAEAWRELKNEEERKAAEDRRFRELLEGLAEYPGPGCVDSAGGAGGPGDPSAMPRDDKENAPHPAAEGGHLPLQGKAYSETLPPSGPQDGVSKSDTAKVPDRWAAFKASAAARLAQAREDGVTFARIEEASGGALTMDGILLMAGAAKVPIEKWSKLDKALTALGYPKENGEAAPEAAAGATHTHTQAPRREES